MSIEESLAFAVKTLTALERKVDALADQVQDLRESGVRPADPNEYLLLPKAALEAGKHPDTLRRAIKAKKLKASRPSGGREWSVRRGDLVEWISGAKKARSAGAVDVQSKIVDALGRLSRKAS